MASRLYQTIIRRCDPLVPPKLRPLWNHPAGPKTIFFWSPIFKWGLVIAAIGDLNRPADKISVYQTIPLAASGFIWARYSLVITPKVWNLAAVNFGVGVANTRQLVRVYNYEQQQKKQALLAK